MDRAYGHSRIPNGMLASPACGAALLLLASCAGEPPLTYQPVPMDELFDIDVRETCAALFRCCSESDRGDMVYADEADCIRAEQASSEFLYARLIASVEAGRSAYDPVAAADCVNESRSCSRFDLSFGNYELFFNTVPACRHVFVPLVALGDACDPDGGLECISGWCTADRVCVQPLADGEACGAFGLPCAPDLYCPSGGGTCRPTRENDEPCDGRFACESDYCDGYVAGETMGVCRDEPTVCR